MAYMYNEKWDLKYDRNPCIRIFIAIVIIVIVTIIIAVLSSPSLLLLPQSVLKHFLFLFEVQYCPNIYVHNLAELYFCFSVILQVLNLFMRLEGALCVWDQSLRDDAGLQCRLSLAETIPRMISRLLYSLSSGFGPSLARGYHTSTPAQAA